MKRIFVLLFIAISLGLFVFIYEIEGDKKREQKKQYNESLFKLKSLQNSNPQVRALAYHLYENNGVIKRDQIKIILKKLKEL